MKTKNKAKVVKVEGCFTEWYAPTYRDPYNDNGAFREFYDEKMLNFQPVIGPSVDGKTEYISGDLGCLADRITVAADDWEAARHAFEVAVELALMSGEEQVVDFHYVYGEFAGLVKERVAAI